MNAIRFRITPDLLKQRLQLPKNTTIRALYQDCLSPELIWWIVLESEDFPEVAEGARPTEAMAQVKVHIAENGPKSVVEFDWGLDGS